MKSALAYCTIQKVLAMKNALAYRTVYKVFTMKNALAYITSKTFYSNLAILQRHSKSFPNEKCTSLLHILNNFTMKHALAYTTFKNFLQ
jgi:hypothetical protein